MFSLSVDYLLIELTSSSPVYGPQISSDLVVDLIFSPILVCHC